MKLLKCHSDKFLLVLRSQNDIIVADHSEQIEGVGYKKSGFLQMPPKEEAACLDQTLTKSHTQRLEVFHQLA